MLSNTDILTVIEEEKTYNTKKHIKKLETQVEKLEKILKDLSEHNLVKYNQQTGKVTLSTWLVNLNREVENMNPATGTIILPKDQEINIMSCKNHNKYTF